MEIREETLEAGNTYKKDSGYWWGLKMKIVTRKTQFRLSDKRGWRCVGK